MSNVIQRDLNKLLSKAYTYENRAGHGCEHLETTYVGSVERGKRIYDVYIDSRGNSWFLIRFKTDHGTAFKQSVGSLCRDLRSDGQQ